MSSKVPQPPKWADRFLSWYCNPKLLEQIQGDVHELFYWRLEEEGIRKAKRSFAWDTIRLFRWSNIKRKSSQTQKINNMGIFKNYFKIGVRNLWKQRMPSLINGLGLALAIACCLVAYQFSEKDFIVDKFHENKDNIHLITPVHLVEGTPRRYARTESHITDLILDNVPGVESMIRYYPGFGRIKVGENSFPNTISFVDPNFFDEFTFPVLFGEEKPLQDRSEVVLSESMADKFFGTEYPIGKSININFRGVQQDFIVSAVIDDKQHESNFDVEIFINYMSIPAAKDIVGASTLAFVTLSDNVSKEIVSDGLTGLISQLPEGEASLYKTISVAPFTQLMDYGQSLIGSIAYGINYDGIVIIAGIALFMLILATFNYVNISTVMAMSRVKEIGVRKVIGGKKIQLIFQFLTENFILCSISLILGLLLAKGFFLPWFNLVAEESFFIDVSNNYRVLVFLGGLLLFITLASGFYPAYIAAKLQPTAIFKDAMSKRGKRGLTGILLTVQLTLALITLINALMFVYTELHNKGSDWGFDRSDILGVSNISNDDFDLLRSKAQELAVVENVSGSKGGITGLSSFDQVKYNGRSSLIRISNTDADFAKTMGLRLTKGRFLDANNTQDKTKSIIVNNTFLRYTGVDSLNSVVMIDSTEFSVVGVVEDYFYNGFSGPIIPCVLKLGNEENFNHLTIKVAKGGVETVETSLSALMEELDIDQATITPMKDVLDVFFAETQLSQNLMVFCASIALCLAAMGIFGLVSLNIRYNIKLFGIKKVLGAGIKHLYKDVYRPFIVIFIVAFSLGGAASVVLVTPILDMVHSNFPDFNVWIVLAGIAILTGVVVLTVNSQVSKLVSLNPVDTLRNE